MVCVNSCEDARNSKVLATLADIIVDCAAFHKRLRLYDHGEDALELYPGSEDLESICVENGHGICLARHCVSRVHTSTKLQLIQISALVIQIYGAATASTGAHQTESETLRGAYFLYKQSQRV